MWTVKLAHANVYVVNDRVSYYIVIFDDKNYPLVGVTTGPKLDIQDRDGNGVPDANSISARCAAGEKFLKTIYDKTENEWEPRYFSFDHHCPLPDNADAVAKEVEEAVAQAVRNDATLRSR